MNEVKYRGFIVEYTPDQTLTRENNSGEYEKCKGAVYTVYGDEKKLCVIDVFTAAVGYELSDSSNENAQLFAREIIDMQYKEYIRMRDKTDD